MAKSSAIAVRPQTQSKSTKTTNQTATKKSVGVRAVRVRASAKSKAVWGEISKCSRIYAIGAVIAAMLIFSSPSSSSKLVCGLVALSLSMRGMVSEHFGE